MDRADRMIDHTRSQIRHACHSVGQLRFIDELCRDDQRYRNIRSFRVTASRRQQEQYYPQSPVAIGTTSFSRPTRSNSSAGHPFRRRCALRTFGCQVPVTCTTLVPFGLVRFIVLAITIVSRMSGKSPTCLRRMYTGASITLGILTQFRASRLMNSL